MRPLRDPQFRRVLLIVLAVVGWAGVAWIGVALASATPPRAGDDLRLLLAAAGRLAAGEPLYVTVPADGSLKAESLFYSYPPPVAQALVPLAALPPGVVLLGWGFGAVLGLAAVARLLSRPGCDLVFPAIALTPYVVVFSVALLMGNVNAWFPLAFGLIVVAVLIPGRGGVLAGGVALGTATMVKLHPASLGLWLVVRAVRTRRARPELRTAVIASVAGGAILAVSLSLGGTALWVAYADFLRTGSAASDLVSPLNIGPASQLTLALNLDDGAARALQFLVTSAAIAATAAVGWLLDDPLPSLGWATAASLVILPVTWIHYPVAIIPIALAAAVRAQGGARWEVGLLLATALVVATLALAVPVAIWFAVALVIAAAHRSRPATR